MRKREHEYRIQADEMSGKVLEYELKVCPALMLTAEKIPH